MVGGWQAVAMMEQCYIWDTEDGTLLRRLSGHKSIIKSIVWSMNNALLASGGNGSDGKLIIWDSSTGSVIRSFADQESIVTAMAWTIDDTQIISGDSEGMLHWWDVASGELLHSQEAHQGLVQALKRSPDGTQLASCGDDGAIRVWHLQTSEHIKTLRLDRSYERLDITGIRGLTDSQKMTLHHLGAIEK